MAQEIVIIGAGGFGREVADVVECINEDRGEAAFEILGFLDDGSPDPRLLEPYGLPHLGPVDVMTDLAPQVGYVIAIGNPQVRAGLDKRWGGSRTSPVLVHPQAYVGRLVSVGPGSVICANASLTNHIRLGRHVHVNLNCTVGHDSQLCDYVTLSPMSAISGNVSVEEQAFTGTGAKINPGLTIGAGAVVGTGAAVVKDVAPGLTVVGVPAKAR